MHEYAHVPLHLQQLLFEDKYGTLHMVHGNTHLVMYGSHQHKRTMLMGML